MGVVYFQFILKNIHDVLLPNTHDSSDLVISSISQIRDNTHTDKPLLYLCIYLDTEHEGQSVIYLDFLT